MAIGQSKQRLDAEAKVTGRARYTDDMGLPGMRHAAYVHSTIAHGMVLSIDASEALALPGVEAVFTADDVPGFLFPTAGHPYSMDPSHGDVADRLLLTKHVRYYGDEVAVVVARDGLTARKAAHLVKVEYEPLPVMTSAETALAPGAPVLQPSVNPDGNLLKQHTLECNGTLDEALAAADVVVEGAYRTPTMQHCHLENQTAYAYMDDMRHIVIVSSTQIPHICRRVVGQALGIPWSSVRVIKPYIGGGFGNKQDVVLEPIVAFLTMKLDGAPVSMELTREECMLCTRVRHAFAMTARAGATKDGKLLGYGLDVLSNTGAYASHGHSIAAAGGSKVCYVYPHATYRFSAKTFYSNIPVGGACRGYGSPQTAYAIECLMDDTARALGMDPLELRAVNCYKPGDTNPSGQAPEVFSLPDMIDIMRPKFKAAKEKAAANSTDTVKRGVGVAIGIYGCGLDGPDSAESWAQYNEDGTVTIGVCWGDHGQGADAGALGTAHEALRPLNIAADRIRLVMNDTSKAPVGGPAGGSRSQLVVGNAIRVACETLIEAMKKPGGGFYTYDEMKAEGREVRQYGKWTTPCTSPDENGQGEPFCCYMYGLFMAEVAVDITTGKTAVEKLTMIADIGKVNNRLVTDGQLYGGLAQGIGLALTEDYEDIKKHSTLIGAGLPYIKDVPDDIELIYLENSRKDGPFGASGVGELPLTAPHAAIINAIYQACGARVRHLPARPEKVLAALKK